MTRAVVVDDYELFRLSLRRLLESRMGYETIEEVATAPDFIKAAAQGPPVTLAVIHPASIGLNERDCLELTERLMPNGTVLVFAEGDEAPRGEPEHAQVKRLSRTAGCDEVAAALVALEWARRHALEGGQDQLVPGAPVDGAQRVPAAEFARLSRRQREILEMLTEGLANKEIGHRLGIAEGTVKAHIHAVFRALGVSNRTQAVMRYAGDAQVPAQGAPGGLDEAQIS